MRIHPVPGNPPVAAGRNPVLVTVDPQLAGVPGACRESMRASLLARAEMARLGAGLQEARPAGGRTEASSASRTASSRESGLKGLLRKAALADRTPRRSLASSV